MKALFQKDAGCLRPFGDEAEAMLQKWKIGSVVSVEVKQPRNPDHHKKFFALLNLIYSNQEHYKSTDEILDAFKFAVGHTKKIKTRRGVIEVPLSISFSAMSQDEFAAFYDKAVDFVCTEVIPGLQREDLAKELMEFVG